MKIAIFGVGAVGGYFGGQLTKSGHEIVFVARGKHLAAIKENGLHVESENGTFTAKPALATDTPADVGPVDCIVLATKAWQVQESAVVMQPMVGENTFVVPLLNGVEAPSQLADVLGEDHVLGGFCRVLSRIEGPGHIVQGGTPPFVAFGELSGGSSERVEQLKAAFDEVGVAVQLPENIQAAMWQKLLFISSFGGVGAATRMPAGIIRSVPEVRQMLQTAMAEVAQVAVARNIPLADDAVERGLSLVDSLPDGATASMQRDIMNGYPSELDAQNGAVVRLGKAVNVATPTQAFLYHTLIASERKARGEL